MDANGDGTIDLEEWTTCMTPELRRGIYKSLSNPDKLNGFQPLVDVAKVINSMKLEGGAVLSLQNYKCHIKIDIVINNYSSYFLKSNKVFDQFDTDAS